MEFDIKSILRKSLVKYPFFGTVIANVKYVESDNVSTLGTDGETVFYNRKFMESLSVDEQIFAVSHENCHIAFNHILRSKGKDPHFWNLATDGVINALLKKDGLKLFDGVVDIEDAINYDAEQLYEKLINEDKNKQNEQGNSKDSNSQSQQNENNDSNNESHNNSNDNNTNESNSNVDNNGGESASDGKIEDTQDVGHDTHDMWKEAVEKNENSKSSNKSKELEKEIKKISQLGEKETFEKNKEERDKKFEELKKSLSKEAVGAGTSTQKKLLSIDNIGKAAPLIDWRYLLREAINYDIDWSYKNATIEDGVLSANLLEFPVPETEIVLDTSGSINSTLLRNFLKECKNILQNSRVKVGCFDTEFYGFHEIRTEEDIDNMQFVGGGGTDFDVAVNAFTNRVENKIIFTDGDAYMPDKYIDAIWIVFGEIKINPKGGKVIYIDEEYLNNMSYLRKM